MSTSTEARLRNAYWCKGLGFTQHRSEDYEKYLGPDAMPP